MLKDIVEVHPLTDYQLRLRFEDGVEGVIDVSKLIQFTRVFEALKTLITLIKLNFLVNGELFIGIAVLT